MPDAAMQALGPFATRILSEEDSQSDLLAFIQQHNQRIFFQPRVPFNSTAQLRPLVEAGARLLIRRTDVLKQLISAEQRDEWITTFGHQVFLQGYAPSSSIKFLKKKCLYSTGQPGPRRGATCQQRTGCLSTPTGNQQGQGQLFRIP